MLSRRIIGIACFLAGLEMWVLLNEMLAPGTVRLPLAGIPILPLAAVPWLIGVWTCSAVAFTLDWQRRASGVVLLAAMAYVLLMDERTYSNHLYLLCLLVLVLTWADDVTARRLMRVQLSIVYGFAALAKVNLSFLSGAVLLAYGRTVLPESWLRVEVLATLALLAVLSEAFLAVAFWSDRLRPWAWAVGLGLHIGSAALIHDGRLGVAIFGLAMVGLYTAFTHRDLAHLPPATREDAARSAER